MSGSHSIPSARVRERRLKRRSASYCFVFRIADALEITVDATRFAGHADSPAVPNELMREQNPFLLGDDADEVLLDFFRIGISRKVEPLRKAAARAYRRRRPTAMPKAVPSTTFAVFRATPGSVRSSSMVCGTWPVEFLDDFLARAHDRLRLVAEKACRANFSFHLARIRVGEILRRAIFLK